MDGGTYVSTICVNPYTHAMFVGEATTGGGNGGKGERCQSAGEGTTGWGNGGKGERCESAGEAPMGWGKRGKRGKV